MHSSFMFPPFLVLPLPPRYLLANGLRILLEERPLDLFFFFAPRESVFLSFHFFFPIEFGEHSYCPHVGAYPWHVVSTLENSRQVF